MGEIVSPVICYRIRSKKGMWSAAHRLTDPKEKGADQRRLF
jgi:hypothetical protein